MLGIAPCDSGRSTGDRRIRGGRAPDLLYMAATRQSAMHEFCERLCARGCKVALVAVMRKLVALINTLLRADHLRIPEPPNGKGAPSEGGKQQAC